MTSCSRCTPISRARHGARATARPSGVASCADARARRAATSSAATSGSRRRSPGARWPTRRARWRANLALRALRLQAAPSVRVFADEGQQRSLSGLDDTPWGAAALQENGAAVERALRTLDARDAVLRAAAWNVLAMAAGPGEPWPAGESLTLDGDPLVRFVQYKALGRHASPAALAQLRSAASSEGDAVLSELLRDVVASGGIGVARTAANASAVTSGTTTSP